MRYFDLHCDTISRCYKEKKSFYDNDIHINAVASKAIEKYEQYFALWLSDELRGEAAFYLCKNMLDYGFANFALVTPALESAPEVPVTLGTSDTVKLIPEGTAGLLVDKAQKSSITTETSVEETVSAPVAKGQKLGMLTVKSGETVLTQIPLVAAEDIPRLTWWDLFLQVLRQTAMAKD